MQVGSQYGLCTVFQSFRIASALSETVNKERMAGMERGKERNRGRERQRKAGRKRGREEMKDVLHKKQKKNMNLTLKYCYHKIVE